MDRFASPWRLAIYGAFAVIVASVIPELFPHHAWAAWTIVGVAFLLVVAAVVTALRKRAQPSDTPIRSAPGRVGFDTHGGSLKFTETSRTRLRGFDKPIHSTDTEVELGGELDAD